MELPDTDSSEKRINLDQPRYNQSTFIGRAKHFTITTNPFNLFASSQQLEDAKNLVEAYRKGDEPSNVTEDELWRAKQLYDSAYHPDTGQKMMLIGRMSAQVPMNMSITGCMLTFYKTSGQTIFWQWINQTFNAVVNYTNRSGDHPIPLSQLGMSYALATFGAVGTALAINKTVHKFPPIAARFVPFVAVAAANCINIPFMRSREISNGIPVFDEYGKRLGDSVPAARKAIGQVLLSRVVMAAPGMLLTAIIMDRLEKRPFLKRYPVMNPVFQVGLVGFLSWITGLSIMLFLFSLVFATPLCCALFPQKSSISVSKLEPELQEVAKKLRHPPETVYFNKGL